MNSEERFGPKLNMYLCFCSGEDQAFPVTELGRHTRRTNGWQSPKLCEYPQELGFRFEGEVELQNLRILVHESKIPSRIEIFIAEASDEERMQGVNNTTYDRAVFRRLGHVNFCTNEENGFEARELKTVSVRRTCVFLKLIIRKPHSNHVNVFGQVGVVAIAPHGHVVRIFRQLSGVSSELQVGQVEDVAIDEMTPDARDAAIQEDAQAATQDVPEGCEGLDAQTCKRIRELLLHKARAVNEEDYDLAKALKVQIDVLRSAGTQIAELEAQKKQAVDNEDYDLAKQLKQQIDALRSQGQPRPAVLGVGSTYNATQVVMPPPNPFAATAEAVYTAGPQPDANSPYINAQASPVPIQQSYDAASGRQSQNPGRGAVGTSFDERPAVAAGKQQQHIDDVLADDANSGGIIATKPMSLAAGSSQEQPMSGPGIAQWEESLNRLIMRLAEDQPKPEVLTGAKAQEAKFAQAEFGAFCAACIFSKRWQLREAALKALLSPDGFRLIPNKTSATESFLQYAGLKTYGINDALAAVFFVVCEGLSGVAKGSISGAASAASVSSTLSNLLPDLLMKAGDNNARVREVAATVLTDIANSDVGPERVALASLAEPDNPGKKPLNHRVHIARIHVVSLLLQEFGLNRKDSRTGLTPESIMTKLVLPALGHSHQDVREGAMSLLVDLYRIAPSVKRYIDDLKPAQRGLIEERIGQSSNAAPAVVSSPKPKGRAEVTNHNEPEMVSSSFSVEKGGTNAVLNAARQVRETASKPSAKPAAKPAPKQVVDDRAEKTCQFCDRYDKRFSEEAFHVHYLRTCPMLCPCPLCTQVTEISNLQNHIVTECEYRHLVKQCPSCKEAVRAEDLDEHIAAKQCIPSSSQYNVCPLCHAKLTPAGEAGWKKHLLGAPGCENNPRAFDGGNGEEFGEH